MIQDIYLNLNIKLNVSDVFDLTITENTFASTKSVYFMNIILLEFKSYFYIIIYIINKYKCW